MAVTFTSNGYDTTSSNPYTEVAWANAHPFIGASAYGVSGPTDWGVSAVAGADRTVSIAPGFGWGYGVTDSTSANETIQLDAIASGSRWDLIVVRRDWTPTAGVTSFQKVNGGATKTIPGSRLVGRGNIDDQPIALVQVTAGQTQPTAIVDLRCWAGNGGAIAKDELVKSYLNGIGTAININGVDWLNTIGANDVPEWRPGITSGSVTLSLVTNDVYKTAAVVFPATYTVAPMVVVSLASAVTGNASRLLVSGYSASTSGFTAKIQTNDNNIIGTSYSITLKWVAYPAA